MVILFTDDYKKEIDMRCSICNTKITFKNSGVWLRPELPLLCFNCKREALFAGLIPLK